MFTTGLVLAALAAPPNAKRLERRVSSGGEITPEVMARAVEILEAAFPRWPPFEVPVAPIDHLGWKLEHPGWAPACLVAEMVDDEMVGVTVRLHRSLHVGGASTHARDWVDHCMHPDHQGTGVYRRMAATWPERHGDYDLGLWSTSHPKVIGASRASDPEQLDLGGGVRCWLLPLVSARALLARRRAGTPSARRVLEAHAAVTASRLRRMLAPPRRSGSDPAVRVIDRFDDRFGPLLEAAANELDFVLERTPALLQWRYCDPRGGRYTVLAAEERGEIVGYAALKVAGGTGYLLDLLTVPGRNEVAESLLEATVDRARAARVAAVECRVPARHPLIGPLARGGFIDARAPTCYVVSGGRRSIRSLDFLRQADARIHLMLGDVDWV